MAILKISRMGHPILRQAAMPVADPSSPEIGRLIADMRETLRDSGGVGLAAPQVHVGSRVILVQIPAERADDGRALGETVLINPVLVPLDDEVVVDWEGCLSIPGLRGLVPRYRRVGWSALDETGRAVAGEAEGFHARVLQHEVDHLDGVLYVDRMPDLSALVFQDQLRSFMAAGPE